MKTDKGLNRYEIHMSDDLLSQIEEIAVSKFDAKIHHRSNKPVIKEAVISLLQLGIYAINDGVEPLKKFNSDNDTDTNRITLDEVNQLITERLKPLEDKLNLLTDNYTVSNSDETFNHTNTDTDSNQDINTNTNTDNEQEYTVRFDDTDPYVKAETVTETAKTIDNTQFETLPDNNNLELAENNEDIITPEKENDELTTDSERAKFFTLAKKHNLDSCDDKELENNLIKFLAEYTEKTVNSNNLSKYARKDKNHQVNSIFWEYFSAKKASESKTAKWQWTRIKKLN